MSSSTVWRFNCHFCNRRSPSFSLVPFAVGLSSAEEVADLIDLLWKDDETILVISSDLSHGSNYRTAQTIDSETAHWIEDRQWHSLTGERACGWLGIQGLLRIADRRGLAVRCVDLRNSGDTSGAKHSVVGYGTFVVHTPMNG